MTVSEGEIYMTASELREYLMQRGLTYSADYYRHIRIYGHAINDNPFVGRKARPDEIVDWLKRHPEFSFRLAKMKGRVGIAYL